MSFTSSVAVVLFAFPSPADEAVVCDRATIDWVFPGNFAAAKERAVRERRLIAIKGISFGVDEEGAKCSTKGTW